MSIPRAPGRWVVRNCVLVVIASFVGSILAIVVVDVINPGPTTGFDDVVAAAFGLTIVSFVPLIVTTLLFSVFAPSMIKRFRRPRLTCVILSPLAAAGALVWLANAWITGIAVTSGVAAVFACLVQPPPSPKEGTELDDLAKVRFL